MCSPFELPDRSTSTSSKSICRSSSSGSSVADEVHVGARELTYKASSHPDLRLHLHHHAAALRQTSSAFSSDAMWRFESDSPRRRGAVATAALRSGNVTRHQSRRSLEGDFRMHSYEDEDVEELDHTSCFVLLANTSRRRALTTRTPCSLPPASESTSGHELRAPGRPNQTSSAVELREDVWDSNGSGGGGTTKSPSSANAAIPIERKVVRGGRCAASAKGRAGGKERTSASANAPHRLPPPPPPDRIYMATLRALPHVFLACRLVRDASYNGCFTLFTEGHNLVSDDETRR